MTERKINSCKQLSFQKHTLKTAENFKNKQKAYEVMFWDMKKCLYSKSLFSAPYIVVKHKC